jgi:integrase
LESSVAWIQRLERKNGKFSYKVVYRDPSRRERTKTFSKRKEAEVFRADIEHQMDRGTYVDPAAGKITLEEFWEHFIRTSPPPAESTRSLYRRQARLYILPHLGNMQLRLLTKPMVKSFLADLQDQGVRDPSVNNVFRLLRRILSVAVEEERIPRNPASRVQAPQGESGEMHFLTAKEVRALASAVPPRYEALILFLSYTGARIGEAAALRMKNLNLVKGQAQIVEASKEIDGKLSIGSTKNKQNRSVTLPNFLVEKLMHHTAEYADVAGPNAFVFTTAQGARVRQTTFRNRVFKPAAARAGLPDGVRPHDLRHTAVAIAIQAGWHPRKIQEMLGHSSIEVTLGTYGHLFDSLHGECAESLDSIYRVALEAAKTEVIRFPDARTAT